MTVFASTALSSPPAGAASDTAAAEKALGAYLLADGAADWPAAMKVSSGLANARARYYDLVSRTADLPPDGFVYEPATNVKVAIRIDKLTPKGSTARAEGTGTVSLTDAGQNISYEVSDFVFRKQGARWLVDSYAVSDASDPTPMPLDRIFATAPVTEKVGALEVRFEVGKSYPDPGPRTVGTVAWSIRVRNTGKAGPARFTSLTARSGAGKAYTISLVATPQGPALQYSGDHATFASKIGFGTADDVAARGEQPLLVWAQPGNFNGGPFELTYTIGGAPTTVTLDLPALPIAAGYAPLPPAR